MVNLSTSAFYERANQQMSSLRARSEKLQVQISSEERLTKSSDDPAAASRLRALDRRERLGEVDKSNSDRAATDLGLVDQALVSMADIVIRAKELALQANSTTLTDANQEAIATEITSLRESLLALANSRDAAGHALFGGEAAGDAYTDTGGTVTYQGVGTAPETDLGDGQKVQRSMTGPDILNFDAGAGATDMFEMLATLAAALTTGGSGAQTAASDAMGLLDAGLEKITTAQTVVGTRQAWVETVAERRTNTSESMAEERSAVGGADLASAITRLQELTTVLEASQASFVKLAGLSLFDKLN